MKLCNKGWRGSGGTPFCMGAWHLAVALGSQQKSGCSSQGDHAPALTPPVSQARASRPLLCTSPSSHSSRRRLPDVRTGCGSITQVLA